MPIALGTENSTNEDTIEIYKEKDAIIPWSNDFTIEDDEVIINYNPLDDIIAQAESPATNTRIDMDNTQLELYIKALQKLEGRGTVLPVPEPEIGRTFAPPTGVVSGRIDANTNTHWARAYTYDSTTQRAKLITDENLLIKYTAAAQEELITPKEFGELSAEEKSDALKGRPE